VESLSTQVKTRTPRMAPNPMGDVTKVFRICLERRPFGLKIESDTLFFNADTQQCDASGWPIEDSDYSFNPQDATIEAIVDPEKLGLSEHQTYPLITEVDFSLLWTDVQNGRQLTVFTRLESIAHGLLSFISQLLLSPS